MKGSVTRWVCDHCDQTLTTYVRVSEPPTHICSGLPRTAQSDGIHPMKQKGKK